MITPSPPRSGPRRSGPAATAPDLCLHLGQLSLDVAAGRHRLELAGDVVLAAGDLVLESAGRDQLVDSTGTRLHLGGLVLRPLDGHTDVAHLLRDARERLVDLGLRLGRRVGRLEGLLARAERLDLRLQPLRGVGELLLLGLQVRVLQLEVGTLLLKTGTPGQRLARQVLTALRQCRLGLALELLGLLVELLGLELEPFAAGRDVRETAADLSAGAPAAWCSCSRASRAGPRPDRAPCWPSSGRSARSAA